MITIRSPFSLYVQAHDKSGIYRLEQHSVSKRKCVCKVKIKRSFLDHNRSCTIKKTVSLGVSLQLFFRREDRILRRCTSHKMIGKVKPELTTGNKYKAVRTLSRELPLELEVVTF